LGTHAFRALSTPASITASLLAFGTSVLWHAEYETTCREELARVHDQAAPRPVTSEATTPIVSLPAQLTTKRIRSVGS